MLPVQRFASKLHFLPVLKTPKTYQNCIKTPSVATRRVKTLPCPSFVGLSVKLGQSLALHLEFHLRVLLEHLGVRLAEELRHPLVGHAARTQPRGMRGTEIVESEVGDFRFPKR